MSTTHLSFTTFSTDLYFMNSGSLMALMDRHQRSPCPELMKYRHTQVGIFNRARQWTQWKFTTHLFPYKTWWTTEIQLFLLMGKGQYLGNGWHSHTHTCADNHSFKEKSPLCTLYGVSAEFPLNYRFKKKLDCKLNKISPPPPPPPPPEIAYLPKFCL